MSAPRMPAVAALLLTLAATAQVLCAQGLTDKQARLDVDPQAVKEIMARVADWQLANPGKYRMTDWTQGALMAGMAEWARIAPNDRYYKALREIAQGNNWQLGPSKYHADDHAIGQMYLELYEKYRDPAMIAPIIERFDYILANPSDETLKYGTSKGKHRYWWCDALFMAPPVWTKLAQLTQEPVYLEFMDQEWRATTDYLYDQEEHLYYRDDRYFTMRSENGAKVFWSRGNGWVFAGLARVLQAMPLEYPGREYYEGLFREMAAKLIAIQQEDGLWRSSLLDPENYPAPETSGTGFFVYGLAWGVNAGLLEPGVYVPHVERGWAGLTWAVEPGGKLGWVQPIGADPRKVDAGMTNVYGVGAFLLAGSEVYRLAEARQYLSGRVRLENPLGRFRDAATIELAWRRVEEMTGGVLLEELAAFDAGSGEWLVTQVVPGEGEAQVLLFQVDMAPGEWRDVWVGSRPGGVMRPGSLLVAEGLFAPWRMDDFAWENDRIAFRMYGSGLEGELVSNGVDVWVKKVTYPVVRDWYVTDDYHVDHGEGLDAYSVGRTLGCGGLALAAGGKWLRPVHNYTDYRIVANGPIRTVFELEYPWEIEGRRVREVKRVSLELGSQLSRFESRFEGEGLDGLEVVAGVARVDGGQGFGGDRWLAYWGPLGQAGAIGCAVVGPERVAVELVENEEHLALRLPLAPGGRVSHWAGAGWDGGGRFDDFDDWQEYVRGFAAEVARPVRVEVGRF